MCSASTSVKTKQSQHQIIIYPADQDLQCLGPLPELTVLPTDMLLSVPLLESTTTSGSAALSSSHLGTPSTCSARQNVSYMSQVVTVVAVRNRDTQTLFDKRGNIKVSIYVHVQDRCVMWQTIWNNDLFSLRKGYCLTCVHHDQAVALDLLVFSWSIQCLGGSIHILVIVHSAPAHLNILTVSLSVEPRRKCQLVKTWSGMKASVPQGFISQRTGSVHIIVKHKKGHSPNGICVISIHWHTAAGYV